MESKPSPTTIPAGLATDLRDRRLLITGAASGIGDGVARQLVSLGARVISFDLRAPSAPVEQHVTCDLSSSTSIDAALLDVGDSLDGLIHVAGVPGTHRDSTVFAVNFLGMRHLTEAALPRLLPGGAIVCVASNTGFGWQQHLAEISEMLATPSFAAGQEWLATNAPEDVPAYYFSKELVTAYVASSALRMAKLGLRINAVSPGAVETPILSDFEESMGKEFLDAVKELVGRHARPADIAPAVTFAASSSSGWMNGQNLIVDGGLVAAISSGTVALEELA